MNTWLVPCWFQGFRRFLWFHRFWFERFGGSQEFGFRARANLSNQNLRNSNLRNLWNHRNLWNRSGIVTLLIVLSASAPTLAADAVTYSKDIAPILFSKCASCHHPNGSAPFSVLSYESVRPHATQIVAATARGYMPPWKAQGGPGDEFVGQAKLTDAERDLLARWVADGAVEGDARAMPSRPEFSEGWQLGRPDLVVTLPKYTLPAEGTDVFRIFVVPIPVDRLRFVRGIEFSPGNARVVHHANIRIDTTPASRRFDEADPAPGYEGLLAHSATYPDGYFLGWTPGQVSPLLPG